jgi:hypothetical protein
MTAVVVRSKTVFSNLSAKALGDLAHRETPSSAADEAHRVTAGLDGALSGYSPFLIHRRTGENTARTPSRSTSTAITISPNSSTR